MYVLDIMVDGTKAFRNGGAILGDVGTSDVTLWVDAASGTAGRGVTLTVEYIQNINNS